MHKANFFRMVYALTSRVQSHWPVGMPDGFVLFEVYRAKWFTHLHDAKMLASWLATNYIVLFMYNFDNNAH